MSGSQGTHSSCHIKAMSEILHLLNIHSEQNLCCQYKLQLSKKKSAHVSPTESFDFLYNISCSLNKSKITIMLTEHYCNIQYLGASTAASLLCTSTWINIVTAAQSTYTIRQCLGRIQHISEAMSRSAAYTFDKR